MKEVELTEKELRDWFAGMARGDFSESECRTALEAAAKVLPEEWLRKEYLNIYLGR